MEVPQEYQALFARPGAQAALRSHRGQDPGALDATLRIATSLGVAPITSTITRLLVDLNRSIDNPALFSKYSQSLGADNREQVLENYYRPYRSDVETLITERLKDDARPVVHLSIHTFTSRMSGRWRPIDIGLLYDPACQLERQLCESWQTQLSSSNPRLRVLMNQPYAGTDDGLTTYLRTRFPAHRYAGIEIEINNRFYRRNRETHTRIVDALIRVLKPV